MKDHIKMDVEIFVKRLSDSGLDVTLREPCPDNRIIEFENRISKALPEQVTRFYKTLNGFAVNEPKFEVFPIDKFSVDQDLKIRFARFDGVHNVGFDAGKLNNAAQWDIVNLETGYLITLTMASFLSNKIWAWLNKKRPIWEQEVYL